ncbi:MAG TPA: universal stress protein [Flavobacteriaceae bacterium]|nr:universal stress protein [Flavobacteriaceae bacterium]
MKNILIPLDYHPTSEKIAKAGYELAQQLGAEIHLVHVLADLHYYNVNYPAFFGYDFNSLGAHSFNTIDEALKQAEEFLKRASEKLDPNVGTAVLQGDTANSILDYANSEKMDLIVMGTHSRSVFEKVFIGSVATSVLEKTKIPVYMVPVKK